MRKRSGHGGGSLCQLGWMVLCDNSIGVEQ